MPPSNALFTSDGASFKWKPLEAEEEAKSRVVTLSNDLNGCSLAGLLNARAKLEEKPGRA